MNKKTHSKKFKVLRIFGRIILGLFIFIFLLLLFIRSPWGQNIIVQKLTNYIEGKTNTTVTVKRVFITFDGHVFVEDLYLEDTHKDTLLYSHELEANIGLLPLIKGTGFQLKSLDWNQATAHIYQKDSLEGFNYQFLIDAFAADSTQTTTPADTTSTFQIELGDFDLKDIHLTYEDAVTGMNANGSIGELLLELNTFDLEAMRFEVDEAALRNTQITYEQLKPLPESTDTTATSPLPFLEVDALELTNVTAKYRSQPDGMDANVTISESYFSVPKIDLQAQEIVADELSLKHSTVVLNMQTVAKETAVAETTTTTPFTWPDWNLTVDEINLEHNDITYTLDGAQPQKGTLNANAIALTNVTLQADEVLLEKEHAALEIANLQLEEASGLALKQLAFTTDITSKRLAIDDLQFTLNNNTISGNAAASYASLQQFIATPEKATLALNLNNIQLALQDVFLLQPDLEKNTYLATLAKKRISGQVYANGTLEALRLSNTAIQWGANTRVNATAAFKNITDTERLAFTIQNFKAITTKEDLEQFMASDSLGISYPDHATLVVEGSGNLEDITAKARLQTSEGTIAVDGNFQNTETIAFDANIKIDQVNLGKLLQNPALDTISIGIKTKGTGTSINTLDATLETDIERLTYNGYDLTPFKLSADIKNGTGKLDAHFKDYNLNAALDGDIVLDSVAPEAHLDLEVTGADLQALGITNKNLRTQLNLVADYKGKPNKFTANAAIKDIVMVYVNDPYYPGDFNIKATVERDSSSVVIDNEILQLELQANADIPKITDAFSRYYTNLISADSTAYDTVPKPVNLHLKTRFHETALISDVFFPGIQEMDTLAVDIDFDESKQSLFTHVYLPRLRYNDMELDSLALEVNAQTNNPDFSFGIQRIDAGRVQIHKITFAGKTKDQLMQMNFNAYDGEERFMHIASTVERTKDSVFYHIEPDSLLLNRKLWNTPQDNRVAMTPKSITFRNFSFKNGQQQVAFGNHMTDRIDKEHMGVEFDGFQLNNFLALLNPEEPVAKGVLDGKFIVVEPYGRTALLAGLNINNLEVLTAPLGNLSIKARALGSERYDMKVALKDGGIDLDMNGDYTAHQDGADLNFHLDLNKFELNTLDQFTDGMITDTQGYVSGNFTIEGTSQKPDFNGAFDFHNAQFNPKMLNTNFTIDNEQIQLSNKGIYFKTFTVKDANNNTFVLDGEVTTKNPTNPEFDLSVKAKNFQVLNSTEEDNDLFYGKANINADVTLTGDLDLPIVDAKLSANEGTDVYYVIPEDELNMVERDGVVVFVNRQNPDAILTRNEEETAAILNGFRLDALLALNKNAVFNVIIDEKTGDNLRIAGKGDLNFEIEENGRTTLTGRYEVTEGHYQMNLYNLVKREFQFAEGSSVTWSGDPMDAQLDVSAIYKIKTSASSLMSDVSSGASQTLKDSYRQRVQFYVYLNVAGALMHPKLTFSIDIPEDDRGLSGGAIYSKVQQLNQQEDQLNKQVFSLLVLNRFFPDTGSDGSSGGTATIARDNLSQALSDQLNMFSDKLLGSSGISLNFGVDSYTDYQGATAENRTDVDITAQKKLFNDRVIVEVGSEVNVEGSSRPGEANQLLGNVSVQYLLTEDGRFRVKGFHKNTYENIIDGQIIVNGISLIFTKEFNKFNELWKAMLRKEEQADEEESKSKTEDNPDTTTPEKDTEQSE
ncbi:Family of unknown function [Pustulibacterium marinum]|uniref:Translocation and assembly module TamB C-terminal domain-containing protein n=1 Tax=Pustulibacterium marinum TaxID=1224947 RepID=A0A1I7GBV4_9FLAO|nr:translocation/assembly module TamB domain-containing protein [Pustulibacterium marinum]SFU45920.1 Family of unknown function [Pustulibacterium marinum]